MLSLKASYKMAIALPLRDRTQWFCSISVENNTSSGSRFLLWAIKWI
jgi:hypothetical protein